MRRKIDLTGQRFGRLVVVSETVRTKRNKIYWNCNCDCGLQHIAVVSGHLRSGLVRSCGCLKSESSSNRFKKDILGKRFGRLIVLSDAGRNKHGKVLWKCKCDCGIEIITMGSYLRNGDTKSCGGINHHKKQSSNENIMSRKKMRCSPIREKSTLFKQIPKCDCPSIGEDGFVTVECKMCGKPYSPTYAQIRGRIKSYNGKMSGESNFYCSNTCKDSCPVYRANTDPRLRKPKSETQKSRSCQNKTLKQLQCDQNNGQSHCEKCGDLIEVDLHHTLPVAEYGEKAMNPASHILLCAGCHVELHRVCA